MIPKQLEFSLYLVRIIVCEIEEKKDNRLKKREDEVVMQDYWVILMRDNGGYPCAYTILFYSFCQPFFKKNLYSIQIFNSIIFPF
jgi:hypothetical protein